MFSSNGIYLCCVLMNILSCCYANTLVITASGPIQGIKSYHDNEPVYRFLRIPYAEPPIGDLRFRKPERIEKWTEILNATEYGPSCMEIPTLLDIKYVPNQNISEDCLFLNIYVPRRVSAENNMSVMIYIHGGSYYLGQGMRYDGYYLALHGNVIVVTINYRLGIFGFLSTGDAASPGNYGLWDQRLAIQWVKENIGVFGGNPSSITLFGQSAGGFSVSVQGLIPKNKGLFQRIIAESGVANSIIAVTNASIVKQIAVSVANSTGCLDHNESVSCVNTAELVRCLRKVDAIKLNNIFLYVYTRPYAYSFKLGLDMEPVVDGDLIADYPERLISNKSSEAYMFFRSLDVIIGTTDGEGSILYNYIISSNPDIVDNVLSCNGLCNIVAPTIIKQFYSNVSELSREICNEYNPAYCNNTDPGEQDQQIMNLYADALFISPAIEALRVHSVKNIQSQSYQYIFRRPSSSKDGVSPPSWFEGAPHASELIYLFPDKYNCLSHKNDLLLRKNMVTYWSNFAKTGNPNSKGMPHWPSFLPGQNYQQLDYNITSGHNLYSERVNFWLKNIRDITTMKSTENFKNSGQNLSINVLFLSISFLVVKF